MTVVYSCQDKECEKEKEVCMKGGMGEGEAGRQDEERAANLSHTLESCSSPDSSPLRCCTVTQRNRDEGGGTAATGARGRWYLPPPVRGPYGIGWRRAQMGSARMGGSTQQIASRTLCPVSQLLQCPVSGAPGGVPARCRARGRHGRWVPDGPEGLLMPADRNPEEQERP